MRSRRLIGLLSALGLAACTVLRPLSLGGGAQVEFLLSEEWCHIVVPEMTGRREYLKFENPYYMLEGQYRVSLGIYSYTHEISKDLAFYKDGELLFDHRIGFEAELSVSFCYETDLTSGETYRVECELDGVVIEPDFQRFALSPVQLKALTEALGSGEGRDQLEIRSRRTVRRFSVPAEARDYLLDPEGTCSAFASRTTS